MNQHIAAYLESGKIFTLATSVDNVPYCAICFYAYDAENNQLVFKSSEMSRHVQEAISNKQIAGTIYSDPGKVGNLRGVQFTGLFNFPKSNELEWAKGVYHKKFPFSLLVPGVLFTVGLEYIKMTDNTLGMGKKIIWEQKINEPVTD